MLATPQLPAEQFLDALERRGIVEWARAGDDRRAVTITLTDRGRRLLTGQHAWLRDRQRTFYATLPPAERERAPDLLTRLAGMIDELAGGPEG